MSIDYFPGDCLICATFSAVQGVELGKALKQMHAAWSGDCQCECTISAHAAEHPHRLASVGCQGVQPREARSRSASVVPFLGLGAKKPGQEVS